LGSAATPEEAARQALAAVDPSTAVTLDESTEVAGRGAYELVLRPRAEGSLVGQVRVAVDSQTSLPLRVQVIPRGQSSPAYQTGFTDLSFGDPGAQVFRFTPPAGSTVTERSVPPGALAHHGIGPRTGGQRFGADRPAGAPTVVGKDWTAVLVTRAADRSQVLRAVGGDQIATAVLNGFRPVEGAYGSGRLLRTNLVSVLWLDDGRLLVGAVEPALLERAASAASPVTGR
jgi:hypothetical protein